jgi:hypothetical protein
MLMRVESKTVFGGISNTPQKQRLFGCFGAKGSEVQIFSSPTNLQRDIYVEIELVI